MFEPKWKKKLKRENPKKLNSDLEFFEKGLEKIIHSIYFDHIKLDLDNVKQFLQLFNDWIETNRNLIRYNSEELHKLESKKWKIDEKETEDWEWDLSTYYGKKDCEFCRYNMQTIYVRDKKDRVFKAIGLICTKCNRVYIIPEDFKKVFTKGDEKKDE